MLRLGGRVPDGVLIGRLSGALRLRADDMGAAVSPFAPVVGRHLGRDVLVFELGVNGGYELGGVGTACFSAGVIWASPAGEARTLLAVRRGRGSNYLYLAEEADRSVVLRDDAGGMELRLPAAAGDWQAVVFGCSDGRVSLRRVGGGLVSADAPDLPLEASLLIGCRAMRQGLAKSLGAGRVAEVLVWPVDVTGDDAAMVDYLDWAY